MTITAIERQKRDGNRYSIFIDGDFAFGMSGTDVLYYKLAQGEEITPGRYDYLVNKVLLSKANESALRYLSHRARTRREMAARLADFPPGVAEKTIAALEGYGYIDDRAFAEDYVRARVRNKGYGKVRLRAELRERGADAAAIDAALEGLDFDEAGAALEKLRRKAPDLTDGRERKKYHGYLERQGFSYDVIQQAFKEYSLGHMREEDEP